MTTLATSTRAQTTVTATSATSTITSYPSLTTAWELEALVECHYTYNVEDLRGSGNSTVTDAPTAWLDLDINTASSTFSCYPPGMFENGNSGTFSPGICPMGWTTAAGSEGTVSGEIVTTGICCSSGFGLDDDGDCIGSYAKVTATPASYISSLSSYSYMTESVTVLPSAIVAHHRVSVQYRDSERGLLGLDDDSSSSGTSGAANFPMAAKIGITVGTVAGVAILLLIIYLIRRCRKPKDRVIPRKCKRDVAISERHLFGSKRGDTSIQDNDSALYSRRGSMPPPLAPGESPILAKRPTTDSAKSLGGSSKTDNRPEVVQLGVEISDDGR